MKSTQMKLRLSVFSYTPGIFASSEPKDRTMNAVDPFEEELVSLMQFSVNC